MQLLGMEAYPEQRICCLYRGQFAPAASKFYRGANGNWEDLRLSVNALAKTSKRILVSVPTKNSSGSNYEERRKRPSRIFFQIPFHSLKSPKDYIQLDKFYETLQIESDNGMIRRFKMQLLVWLTMTESGEFSEIGQLYRHLLFCS